MSQFFAWMGEHDRAVDAGRRTLRIAGDLGDFALQVGAQFRLGQAFYARGDYREGVEVLERNLAALAGEHERQRLGLTGLPSVLSRAWLCWCQAELGDFARGATRGLEAQDIADAVAHPFDRVVASFGIGIVALRQGTVDVAIPALERALGLCERAHIPFWFPLIAACLGSAYALSGRSKQALPLLVEAVTQHADLRLMGVHALFVAWHGEAQLLAGETAAAEASGQEALALALRYQERGHEAWSRWLLGEIASHPDRRDAGAAEASYRQAMALAEERGMRPLLARCHLGLGRLHARLRQRDAAAARLADAVAGLRALDMSLWLVPAEVELEALGR
jgi:tetratricopeptide (TPR) repeat protein